MPGFCVGTFGVDLSDSNALQNLRTSGVCELSLSSEMIMRKDMGRKDCEKLRQRLELMGLKATTSHPPFGSYNEPFSVLRQHPSELERELEWMREFICRCGLLGIHAIPLHTGGAMLPRAKEWETECARRYVSELLPAAERSKVIIAIENTNHATPIGFYPGVTEAVPLNKNIWEFDDTERILQLVQHFDSPWVRVCYDTGHSHLLGRMLPDLHRFLPFISLFHIHDNDGAGNDSHTQPGYGNAPWAEFFRAIDGRCDAPLFVEARPYWRDLGLMMEELKAIAEERVIVKPGGFLQKDEDTGRIVILPESAPAEESNNKEGLEC